MRSETAEEDIKNSRFQEYDQADTLKHIFLSNARLAEK